MTMRGALCRTALFGWAACVSAQQGGAPGSPTVSQFPAELAHNFRNLVRLDNLAPLLIGTTASLATTVPDDDVAKFFLPTRRMKEFGDIGEVLGGPIVVAGGTTALFVAGRVSHNQQFRELTYSLAQATTMSLALAGVVKSANLRLRPNLENRRSFYSGHASNAFAWATVISRGRGLKTSIPAYAVAVLIGGSRLEINKHYLSDVAAGATIGYLIGRSVGRTRAAGKPGRVGWGATPLRGGLGVCIRYGVLD